MVHGAAVKGCWKSHNAAGPNYCHIRRYEVTVDKPGVGIIKHSSCYISHFRISVVVGMISFACTFT